jgi:hypothetical protein
LAIRIGDPSEDARVEVERVSPSNTKTRSAAAARIGRTPFSCIITFIRMTSSARDSFPTWLEVYSNAAGKSLPFPAIAPVATTP